MFVFDVSDTEPLPDAKPLPRHVTDPFAKHGPGWVDGELEWTVENAKRDGVRIAERDGGSQSAGQISVVEPGTFVSFQFRTRPYPESCGREGAVRAAPERSALSGGAVRDTGTRACASVLWSPGNPQPQLVAKPLRDARDGAGVRSRVRCLPRVPQARH